MATQDKLLKSLEILKHLTNSNLESDGTSTRKKDKLHHCSIITDAISNSTIRIAPNFNQLLSFTIEILLQLCDDADADVRMFADECLNRTIRAMCKDNISKVEIELHKEIKKNGAARSLRAALWRFAQLAHYIRPHKGKPYVVNLTPCIVKISERSEDQIHETLANSLPKILAALGCYTTDNDVKTLLKAFLANISSQSALIRRSAASCILTVCLNCRKPSVFVTYVLNNITDLLVPIQENQAFLIIGVMGCLKLILPHINDTEHDQEIQGSFGVRRGNNETPLAIDKLLQVYELCLFYLSSSDHNIVNAALETLNVLLQNCPPQLKAALLATEGLNRSRIYNFEETSKYKLRSPSVMSIATTITAAEDNVSLENELTENIQADIEKWINESTLSVGSVHLKATEPSIESTPSTSITQSESFSYDDFPVSKIYDTTTESLRSESVCDHLDKLVLSETSSEKSCTLDSDERLTLRDISPKLKEMDIGGFRDKDVALKYCLRLIAKKFLLTGYPGVVISDKLTRVSVKSLALSCLSTILQLYPQGFMLNLDKNASDFQKGQIISDVLLYETHSDPQLRGAVRVLIGYYLRSVLIQSGGRYKFWLEENHGELEAEELQLKNLINTLKTGLEDDSSNCTRQTLQGISLCLSYLYESEDNFVLKPLLMVLPLVANNLHWLVKVKLMEILCELSYNTLHHNLNSGEFQNKVICNVLFELLKDPDQRVRTACSKAFVKIIPHLYFEQFSINETTVSSKAFHYKQIYYTNLGGVLPEKSFVNKHIHENRPYPFSCLGKCKCERTEYSLSKIISKLYHCLFTTTSKHHLDGCIEALFHLAKSYPTTVYSEAWSCFKNFTSEQTNQQNSSQVLKTNGVSSVAGLLTVCANLLTSSVVSYDINSQQNLLNLCGHLFAGMSVKNAMQMDVTSEDPNQVWKLFSDKLLKEVAENLLNHIIKLLNIFHHVIDEVIPILPQSKPVLPNLPSANTLSPIKRRKSDVERSRLLSPGMFSDKEEKTEKKNETNAMGYFANIPYYMKLYEVLRTAYTNYKVSLDSTASGKFLGILCTTLQTLSIMLEIGTLVEFGRVAEEILTYLRSIFALETTISVECVYQLLKCLFNTNLTADMPSITENVSNSPEQAAVMNGMYYDLYQKPYTEFCSCIDALNSIHKIECDGDSTIMGYLHRKELKKTMSFSRSSDKILANYIRMFEPMVIKALKQYTITSDIRLQCWVLKLLSLLVKLKVNYCLLDADQIFIGFVLKQFEFIEEGQISYPNEIIPSIFHFLAQLSYGKQHSKSIITVAKIIQLCDGLMASGQPLITHCIPALEPIVEDIFLIRNKSNTPDFKELETTREVLLSMLLRLLEYTEVVELLVLILNESKYCIDDTEKWGRWSKQIMDVLLPMLRNNKIQLLNMEAVLAMKKLIFVFNPSVFKPINPLLIMMFQAPPTLDDSLASLNVWFSKILICFLLVTQLKEDALLLKILETREEFSPSSVFNNFEIADPLNVTKTSAFLEGATPDTIFVRFMFRVIELVAKKCIEVSQTEFNVFLVKQLSLFLIQCMYICQSGSHCKIANATIKMIAEEDPSSSIPLNEINQHFLQLKYFFPTIVFEWSYLLTLLNYNNRKYWAHLLQVPEDAEKSLIQNVQLRTSSINLEIIRFGACIAYCDYLSENLSDLEQLSWMVSNNIELLVNLYKEPPVSELISALHRNAATSGLVIKSLSTKCSAGGDPIFKTKCLKIVENCHIAQIGALLNLLLPAWLNSRHLCATRLVSNLASRKIEVLLTLSMEEVNNLFSREELLKIMKSLVNLKLARKNEALVGLLNKLATQFYDLSPLDFNERRTVNPEYIKKLNINKTWYLSQVVSRCCSGFVEPETAELLSKLDYVELINIMSQSDFDKLILKDCIHLGANIIKRNELVNEPILIQASILRLLDNITAATNVVPKPHQVYQVVNRERTASEIGYSAKVTEQFMDENFCNFLGDTIPSVICYIESVPIFPCIKIPDSSFEDLVKFAVLCLEFVNFLINVDKDLININLVDEAVKCANIVLQESHLCSILALSTHSSWLCSAVNSIFKLVDTFLLKDEPLPSISKKCMPNALNDPETISSSHCRYQLIVLVAWLEKIRNCEVNIPTFLLKPIKSIIISLSRLPLVNSYVLIPPSAWKSGLISELPDTSQISPLPTDLLQDKNILEEFIFRITLLGWTNRQQFEETWMNLLSVVCYSPPDEEYDLNLATHATSLTIQAITSLLIKTLYYPIPGNNVSEFMHVSRSSVITENHISIKKLHKICNNLQNKFMECANSFDETNLQNVFDNVNLEKQNKKYSVGQVSVEYLMLSTKINTNADSCAAKMVKKRDEMLENACLDITSCTQFLLDLYQPWIMEWASTPLKILHEVVRSILIVSDIFTDKGQFQWMLNVFLELSKTHVAENDILQQYIVIGICKSAAVTSPELETYETIKKLLTNSLKSSFLPPRIASLHGILYVLQGCLLSNTVIGGISEEMQLILPIGVDYVQNHFTSGSSVLKYSQQHSLLVWALAFYLIENLDESAMEANFFSSVIQTALNQLTQADTCTTRAIMKGLERLLVLKKSVLQRFEKQVYHLALEKLKNGNPKYALPGLQLLLTFMYTDCKDHLENVSKSTEVVQSNPDHLVHTIEKVSAIFDRIKKGHVFETEIIASILPDILDDFFSPSDILTKVIGEFLSIHQPHPKLLSSVVFQVFKRAINQAQLPLLQDWVVFSLSNFTQSLSLGMATWCLTCFFISASTNDWLRSFFPHVQSRMGRFEHEDRKMLCIAGCDFYRNLSSEKQKQTFINNFEHVKNQNDMPFNDLLASL